MKQITAGDIKVFDIEGNEKGFITNHSMYHLSEKTHYRRTIQTFWLKEKQNWLRKLKSAINLD